MKIKIIFKWFFSIFYYKTLSLLNSPNLHRLIKNSITRYFCYAPWNIKDYLKNKLFFAQFIKKGDLCFDIGANNGNITNLFLKNGAEVICVEPQINCLRKLYKKFGNNKKVIIIGKALAEKEGYRTIFINENENTLSTLSDKWRTESRFSKYYNWNKQQQVKAITLDNLIQLYGVPKFCKIDVEGFELNVLKGLTQKIQYISFEFTREFLDDMKKCISYLKSLGQVKLNCDISSNAKFLLSRFSSPMDLYYSLDLIKDVLLWGDIYVKFI